MGELQDFKIGDLVEKYTGEARWEGYIVSAYYTRAGKLRYVVEVTPQGFQMIAVPGQLRHHYKSPKWGADQTPRLPQASSPPNSGGQ